MEVRMILKIKFFLIFCLLAFSITGRPSSHIKRIGIGLSNQFINDIPAISLKIQRSRNFALGTLFSYDSNDNKGGWGFGIKFYNVIIEEPNLNFYSAFMGGILNQQGSENTGSRTGFQIDLTLGSEFHFNKIESLGFSFEFGISLSKIDDFVVKIVGHNFITSSVHFYF
jgi:hypothetical protein